MAAPRQSDFALGQQNAEQLFNALNLLSRISVLQMRRIWKEWKDMALTPSHSHE